MPKILYVEQPDIGKDIFSRRLTRKGFECVVASSGEQAIELAKLEQPDLILMEMELLVKSGWEVAKELKAAEDTKDIPIIALVAHAMSKDREKALAIGCDDCDTQPIELARLLGKIHNLLDKQK
ncbi:response regulator [Candidatus Albibeggiatoa sp. nov. NOAA]|uniref:response regulator n=1 Tax=Candidatus Albibeggiatoa sp. nov. NOAA TaxID=3162724 RepID=UPI0032FF67B0|nr:response regulator [Thiotrichaceae bacterium]